MPRALLFACLFFNCFSLLNAQSPDLSIEHSVKVEFPTQAGYDYTVYSTTDPNQQSGWKPMGLISHATGEKATFFYQTSPDQKVFFKVEGEPSTGAPSSAQTASILPITSLPPSETPGLYDLGVALGENPTGGAYRMVVPPGTFDYVILLPHPSKAGYHGIQLKLSLFQGGTGLGSGRVVLKVPTTDGSSYEPLKMVDNGTQSIVEEVVIMDATGSTQPRKVVIDLFNDSRSSDASGGQWVINTPSEGGGSAIGHQWEGTHLALKKEGGSWGDFVDLRGAQGERGLKGDKGDQGNPGLKGDKGDKGATGSVTANGIDLDLVNAVMRRSWSNQSFTDKDFTGISIYQTSNNFGDGIFDSDGRVANSNFSGVTFRGTRFVEVSFENCNFQNSKFISIDEPSEIWNFFECDFAGAEIFSSLVDAQMVVQPTFHNCVLLNGVSYSGEIRGWKKFLELGRPNGNSGSGDDGSAGEINQSELLEDAYFLVNTIQHGEEWDTVMVGFVNSASESLRNDDIDNEEFYDFPQNFSRFDDEVYQNRFDFEMSALDVKLTQLEPDGFFRVIISNYDEYPNPAELVYNNRIWDDFSYDYEPNGTINFGVVSNISGPSLNVDPLSLNWKYTFTYDEQMKNCGIVDFKIDVYNRRVTNLRVNEGPWFEPSP